MIDKNIINHLRTHQIILDDEGTYQISHNGSYKQATYWDFRHLDQAHWYRIEYCKHRIPAYVLYYPGSSFSNDSRLKIFQEMITRMGIIY
jgi:hypothetical protein